MPSWDVAFYVRLAPLCFVLNHTLLGMLHVSVFYVSNTFMNIANWMRVAQNPSTFVFIFTRSVIHLNVQSWGSGRSSTNLSRDFMMRVTVRILSCGHKSVFTKANASLPHGALV